MVLAKPSTAPAVFEATQNIGSISVLERLVATFRQAGVELIVVAAPADEQKIEKQADKLGIVYLPVADSEPEMFSLAKAGLAYLHNNCKQVLVVPIDTPLFTAETVRRLAASGQPLANPVFNGKKGHPLLLSAELIPPVLAYKGANGLRGAIRQCGVRQGSINVLDEGVLMDLEETEEYESLLWRHSLQQLHPEIKLRLALEKPFFGPGTRQFLQLIQISGSVRAASTQMGLSYSKAWKMLALMEEQLGYTVVQRQQGGKNGGKAALTEKGGQLLARYTAFEKEIKETTAELFQKHFGSRGLPEESDPTTTRNQRETKETLCKT